ncbi:hypothetical protein GMAR_ORF145 [Golden Marseillevirus]|uniref:hypothetical protein n=1 Tax=Golden Marseillevirus TaxID=1720526 RepID=UPI000877A8E1|nr:hypothetical protein GMAR_ORF145 [Golden Marseillevirus]ALX27519.1 hypothetical protein GMAR_ORF145 [Golden Marseillevirus]
MDGDEYDKETYGNLFSEDEEEREDVGDEEVEDFEGDIEEGEGREEEIELDEKERYEKELEEQAAEEKEDEEDTPSIQDRDVWQREERYALSKGDAERQAEKLQSLGYDVEVERVGVFAEDPRQRQTYSKKLTMTEKGLVSRLAGRKKVVEEKRVSTKKTKKAAKRKSGVRKLIDKSKRKDYAAKKVGTVKQVGKELREVVEVYRVEEKPYEKLVALVKRWKERYEASDQKEGAMRINTPPEYSQLPKISKVLLDEKLTGERVVYDIPTRFSEFAILQKRSENIQKIMDAVKDQRKLLTKEKMPQYREGSPKSRLRFPKPEDRIKLTKEQRDEIDLLVRQIYEAAEEARKAIAPRTESGAFLLLELDRIAREREKAKTLKGKEKKAALDKLKEEELIARNEAVLIRTRLANNMGLATKKRKLQVIEDENSERKVRTGPKKRTPVKKSDLAFAAWLRSRTRDAKTRKFARKLLSEFNEEELAEEQEQELDRRSKTTKDYLRRLAVLSVLLNPDSGLSQTSKTFHKNFKDDDLRILTVEEEKLMPEALLSGAAPQILSFLKKRENALSRAVYDGKPWSEKVKTDIAVEELFGGETLDELDTAKETLLRSDYPSPEVRKAVKSVWSRLVESYDISGLEKRLFKGLKSSISKYRTKYYLKRICLIATLLRKKLSDKSPYLSAKLESGAVCFGCSWFCP